MKTKIERTKLNFSNIEKLSTVNDMLENLYGKEGSLERDIFKKEAYSFYNNQIINKEKINTKIYAENAENFVYI